MKVILETTQRTLRPRVEKAAVTASQKIEEALKQLQKKFADITEIGKFKPIKIDIENPMKDSAIKKASIVIEPLADKNDFRTRTLSFVAYSPYENDKLQDVTIAIGNKFSIESALKNNTTKTAFKNFLKSAEKLFS